MKRKKNNPNYKSMALVCRYVMLKTKKSGRSISKHLGIHFTSWYRYVRGERLPSKKIKNKLVALMGVEDFMQLVQLAYHGRRSHY